MSHVDEGALHAYLDGALDEYPTGQARRIRAHLERCERCAEALAEARRVREQTERILASPELNVAPPPLEELRRLARSSDTAQRRTRPLAHRFGWAASVVLALGVGWMLRGGSVPVPPESAGRGAASMAAESVRSESATQDAVAAPAARREAEALKFDGARAQAPAPAVLPVAPEPLRAPSVEVAPVLVVGEDEARLDDVLIERVASVPPPPEALSRPDTQVAAMEATGTEPPAPATDERSTTLSGADARTALSSRVDGASGLTGTGAFDRGRETLRAADRADDGEPGSLVVPGLEVLSIVWREEGVAPAGVRVIQRLDGGGELELIHLPEGFEPGLVAPPAMGVTELVVPRGQGWLILRASLDESDLRELLRRLDEAPPI
jgi:anti-sigma factor RsiW